MIPPRRDLLLGVLFTAAAEAELAAGAGGRRGMIVAAAAAGLFFFVGWSRQRPRLIALVVALAIVGQAALSGGLLQATTPLVAIAWTAFWVGWKSTWPRAVVTGMLVSVALAVANQLDSTTTFSFTNDLFFFGVVVVGAPVLLGRILSSRSTQIALLRERTVRLAADEETAVEAARIEERMRLMRGVHEAVAQRVGEIVILAGGADRLVSSDRVRALAAIGEIEATARASLDELRGVIGLLRISGEGTE